MSQQEFEPRQQQHDEEIHQPQYPYSWSDRQEGMPRDEPLGSYSERPGEQYQRAEGAQVPWWARPQPHQSNRQAFRVMVVLLVLFFLAMGGFGLIGIIVSGLFHLIGLILSIFFGLLLFLFILVFVILAIVGRALSRAFGPRRMDRRRWRGIYWDW